MSRYEVEDEQRAQEEAEQRCPLCRMPWSICPCDDGEPDDDDEQHWTSYAPDTPASCIYPGQEYLDALKRREPERKRAEAERAERLAAERIDARKAAQDG